MFIHALKINGQQRGLVGSSSAAHMQSRNNNQQIFNYFSSAAAEQDCGIMGYAKKGSTASLAGGLTTGLLLLLAGFLSRQAYYRHKNSYFALVLQLAVAALLSWVMGHRYWDTRKMMPAGVVCIISLVMTKFYIFMVATGGNPIPVKAD